MGLLRQKNKVKLFTGVHTTKCASKVDLEKKYTVCTGGNPVIFRKHFSTDDWQEADAKFVEWSGEEKLKFNKGRIKKINIKRNKQNVSRSPKLSKIIRHG